MRTKRENKNEFDTKKMPILCCVYDSVADNFGAPTLFVNENVAVRSFTDLLNNEPYKSHIADYALVLIGCFSSFDGVLYPVERKTLIRGVDIVSKE